MKRLLLVLVLSLLSTPVFAISPLDIVNSKRAQRGLYPLAYDGTLTARAIQKSNHRAHYHITGHDRSNMAGARVEGVGHSYGYRDPAQAFTSCYLYSSGFRSAGAAISYDRSGRAYYTLLLK